MIPAILFMGLAASPPPLNCNTIDAEGTTASYTLLVGTGETPEVALVPMGDPIAKGQAARGSKTSRGVEFRFSLGTKTYAGLVANFNGAVGLQELELREIGGPNEKLIHLTGVCGEPDNFRPVGLKRQQGWQNPSGQICRAVTFDGQTVDFIGGGFANSVTVSAGEFAGFKMNGATLKVSQWPDVPDSDKTIKTFFHSFGSDNPSGPVGFLITTINLQSMVASSGFHFFRLAGSSPNSSAASGLCGRFKVLAGNK